MFLRYSAAKRNLGGAVLLLPLGEIKPLILPGVSKKAMTKEKGKNIVCLTKEKERYRVFERNSEIFAESILSQNAME